MPMTPCSESSQVPQYPEVITMPASATMLSKSSCGAAPPLDAPLDDLRRALPALGGVLRIVCL
jgi:hypothetical protein